MAIAAAKDKTRELQRTLYRAAKADSRRRFHALHDKVHRRDVLERAWGMVRANRGAAGIDRITIEQVEDYGVSRVLDQLEADLKTDSYKAQPARRVFIPKPGGEERRPLSIPTVGDRIVQAAAKIVIEPIFEADFMPCSFGFRPKKAAHDALQVLLDETWRGARWVVETDIASCFEEIPHDRLMAAVEERIVDRKLLRLLRAMLGAGVLHEGAVRRSDAGTPQGGVISPLLANVYLHRLDRRWGDEGCGTMVRYADDLVVLCDSERDARRALAALRVILADLGLRPKQAKTRIVHLREGGPGFDFLGFHHRWVRGRTARSRHLCFLARWPSARAMQHARDRIRELTHRRRLLVETEVVVGNLNRFLRGWSSYFRYGNSARHLVKIRNYALGRLALFVAKRHKRSRDYGWWTVVNRSPDQLGLVNLNGTIVAPRPNRPWRR
ncbi:MAG TPA: group II intron reverse transcriptase/maturase [Solirubrobacterales bacterium]|jgi:RNA-directed DNA polymerase|nr:group II intron reverse transcriptase/maturase [Solirubrobacterales bacterium]